MMTARASILRLVAHFLAAARLRGKHRPQYIPRVDMFSLQDMHILSLRNRSYSAGVCGTRLFKGDIPRSQSHSLWLRRNQRHRHSAA